MRCEHGVPDWIGLDWTGLRCYDIPRSNGKFSFWFGELCWLPIYFLSVCGGNDYNLDRTLYALGKKTYKSSLVCNTYFDGPCT